MNQTGIKKQLGIMLQTNPDHINNIKVAGTLVDFKHGDVWMWARLSKDGKKVRKNTIRTDRS